MTETRVRTVQQLFDLSGKTALITGGSRGLGLQMAEALGEAGARLVITARKEGELQQACAHLREAGIQVTPMVTDLAREEEVLSLAERALETLGQVDILVNNAGATWGGAAEDYPLEGWDKVMTLNLRHLFLLTREIGRRSMIPRRYGRVVNIASNAALGGNREFMQAVGYNTSKGAVVTFTRALAAEWGAYNITVNAIGPGVFPSKMSRYLTERHGVDDLAARVPLNQVGDEEGLKGAVLLFASDAGKHTTGQFLLVDGGASAMIAG
ncbi:SDR family oxidoreductase [Alloalcanivorax mobilis]|uniref:SDR family oxidoreductase n=1 Tax=Alloalcanivorax mobilis TaxID=2019569 RepID=UPI000B5B104A|nr:SDR family oxidoreductase [Alloalcanivorax mobilis]ASK35654.1 gluconate 5-dehydrogenase [Alcanivorax sp. N3-2A]|tara:strand:+ start:1301 stop:2104 length:804 start_codon:yes stop_codon:yes gene_type:complete